MKKTLSGRSGLLLTEIILSLLFFSLSGAVCLQMFVRASLLSRETAELDMAVRHVSSAAEVLNQPGHTAEHLRLLYPGTSVADRKAYVWFDGDFAVCGEEEAFYRLEAAADSQDGHTTLWSVTLYGGDSREIYRLEGSSYQPLARGEHP